ncbi:MAG: hypothetical protein NC818_06440, partial [Candidatus Omnitrophica bacterium]|nr:hypothetical protein [Candidatus Omnitrophota bacterium]
ASVGSYSIDINGASGEGLGNYTITYNNGTLTVTAKPITVTADSGQSKTQGEPDPALTYQITSGSLVGDDSFTGALTREPGEDPGDYAILQGTLTLGDNYAIDFISALFTILAAVVPPTPTTEALVYDYLTERWRWPVQEIIGTDTGTRVYAMDPQIKPIPVYFYHPVTPTDAGAFQGLALTADMYEFIENSIRARGQEFFPWLEEEFKKRK